MFNWQEERSRAVFVSFFLLFTTSHHNTEAKNANANKRKNLIMDFVEMNVGRALFFRFLLLTYRVISDRNLVGFIESIIYWFFDFFGGRDQALIGRRS